MNQFQNVHFSPEIKPPARRAYAPEGKSKSITTPDKYAFHFTGPAGIHLPGNKAPPFGWGFFTYVEDSTVSGGLSFESDAEFGKNSHSWTASSDYAQKQTRMLIGVTTAWRLNLLNAFLIIGVKGKEIDNV